MFQRGLLVSVKCKWKSDVERGFVKNVQREYRILQQFSARVPGSGFETSVPVKKNPAVSNLVIRWKTICHPFIQLYSFVSVSQQRPVRLVIPLGQTQKHLRKRCKLQNFFSACTLKSMPQGDVLGRVF